MDQINCTSGSSTLTLRRTPCMGSAAKKPFPTGWYMSTVFGGAGVCTLKGALILGTQVQLLLRHSDQKPFEKIICCEKDLSLADACRAVLRRPRSQIVASLCMATPTSWLARSCEIIPVRALTLAFVDPKGRWMLSSSSADLANNARVDIVVLSLTPTTLSETSTYIVQTQIPNSIKFCNYRYPYPLPPTGTPPSFCFRLTSPRAAPKSNFSKMSANTPAGFSSS